MQLTLNLDSSVREALVMSSFQSQGRQPLSQRLHAQGLHFKAEHAQPFGTPSTVSSTPQRPLRNALQMRVYSTLPIQRRSGIGYVRESPRISGLTRELLVETQTSCKLASLPQVSAKWSELGGTAACEGEFLNYSDGFVQLRSPAIAATHTIRRRIMPLAARSATPLGPRAHMRSHRLHEAPVICEKEEEKEEEEKEERGRRKRKKEEEEEQEEEEEKGEKEEEEEYYQEDERRRRA